MIPWSDSASLLTWMPRRNNGKCKFVNSPRTNVSCRLMPESRTALWVLCLLEKTVNCNPIFGERGEGSSRLWVRVEVCCGCPQKMFEKTSVTNFLVQSVNTGYG